MSAGGDDPTREGGGVPPDPREMRAAEYVRGTLPPDERAALARDSDPATAAAVLAWERRLAPLGLAAPDVAPPPRVWAEIARALSGPAARPANDNRLDGLARQVRRWRLATVGTGLVAAGLALFIAVDPRVAERGDGRYVAVVTSGGALPALILNVDTRAGTAQVRPVKTEAPTGRSLQLWYIGAGAAPQALGLVGEGATRVALPAGAGADGAGTFAVSVEPPGGSPTGLPTGQVIYTGTLIRD